MIGKLILTAAAVTAVTAGGMASAATANAPDEPKDLYSFTSGSGKLKFYGEKIVHCSVDAKAMGAQFISQDGHDVKVSVQDGKGTVTVTVPERSYQGTVTTAHLDETQSFFLTGTMDIDGAADQFNFTGKCPKPER